MSAVRTTTPIQQLLAQWRTLGCQRLPDSTEQIGWTGEVWLHKLLPGESAASVAGAERDLGAWLPAGLKSIYRTIGGLSLFDGMFELAAASPRSMRRARAHGIPGLIELNNEVAELGWKPPGAVAIARNAWDETIHLTGIGRTTSEIVRCDRDTGSIIERHRDAVAFLAARLGAAVT